MFELDFSVTGRDVVTQVCREYQRGVCTRTQSECRYAHPPNGMAVDADNHVTVCMDFIKGRCHRETCRYFHPPPHLQAQIKTSQQRAIVSCFHCRTLSLTESSRPCDALQLHSNSKVCDNLTRFYSDSPSTHHHHTL